MDIRCPSHHPRMRWVSCELRSPGHHAHAGRAGGVWASWLDSDAPAPAQPPSRPSEATHYMTADDSAPLCWSLVGRTVRNADEVDCPVCRSALTVRTPLKGSNHVRNAG